MKKPLLNQEKAKGEFLEKRLPVIFLLPALLIVFLLLLYPIISSFYYSTTDKSLLRDAYQFVGASNYRAILTDRDFQTAFCNSVVWTAFSVTFQLLVGLIAALCLQHIRKLRGFYRTALIIPWAFPNIVIAFTWKWLMNDLYGYVNAVLMKLGVINSPILFLANPKLAMPALLFINTWFGFPFMMVSILAALQAVPKSEYEAAQIDGANAVQSFFFITFPHIRTVVGLLVVLRTIWAFNNFDLVFLITGGGPGTVTETLPIYAYLTGWQLNALGKASAVAAILLVFLLVVSLIYLNILNRTDRRGESV